MGNPPSLVVVGAGEVVPAARVGAEQLALALREPGAAVGAGAHHVFRGSLGRGVAGRRVRGLRGGLHAGSVGRAPRGVKGASRAGPGPVERIPAAKYGSLRLALFEDLNRKGIDMPRITKVY